jgi:hypothetical protein
MTIREMTIRKLTGRVRFETKLYIFSTGNPVPALTTGTPNPSN